MSAQKTDTRMRSTPKDCSVSSVEIICCSVPYTSIGSSWKVDSCVRDADANEGRAASTRMAAMIGRSVLTVLWSGVALLGTQRPHQKSGGRGTAPDGSPSAPPSAGEAYSTRIRQVAPTGRGWRVAGALHPPTHGEPQNCARP